MNEDFSIVELFPVFKKNLKWIILVAIIFLIISILFSCFFVTKKYTSTAKMIASFTTLDKEKDEIPNAVSTAQISAATALANSYTVILKSDYAANRVYTEISKQWKNISIKKIQKSINISTINDTEVLKISITTVNPELSKDICDAFEKVAPKIIEEKSYGQLLTLDSGNLPQSYSSPNITKNAIIGCLIGIVISLVIIIISFLMNNKIRGESDVERKYNIPVLGSIPTFASKKSSGKKHPSPAESSDVGRAQNNFFVIEAYKNIRTNLMYTFNSNDSNRIIAVSGAEAEAGKSITSANLAIAFAQNNFRTLMIDADMRKPTQQKLFKRQNTDGLSKVLSGQSKFDSALQKNVMPNLDILTSGPIPPNPSELMSSHAMESLLADASKKYDCVLVDTPPINYVTDCLTIANKTCGIVLVARQYHTEYSDLSKTIDSVKTVGGKILGIIVSDVSSEKANSKYYHNKYYKPYYAKSKSGN